MTQRETILRMLKDAGEAGVRSDTFYRERLPRAAARIEELRQDFNITSTREGKFVRYRLAGVGRESERRALLSAADSGESPGRPSPTAHPAARGSLARRIRWQGGKPPDSRYYLVGEYRRGNANCGLWFWERPVDWSDRQGRLAA